MSPTDREPTTAAGRALLNLVREPLIYGVTDRMDLRSGYESAWAIRDGILAIEAEAAARASASEPDSALSQRHRQQ